MPNYANAYDVWKCEPPDTSHDEIAFEKACKLAFDEYMDDGSLPGRNDPSDVDEALLEVMPEALDGLISAKDDEALLELAKEIRDKRIEIIETLIADNIKAA